MSPSDTNIDDGCDMVELDEGLGEEEDSLDSFDEFVLPEPDNIEDAVSQ